MTFSFVSPNYIRSTYRDLDVIYESNELGGLTRILHIGDEEMELSPKKPTDQEVITWGCNLLKIFERYDEAMAALGNALKWDKREDVITLNLSHLGISELPPQIGCFTDLQNLDLRGNNLSTLPPELKNLPLKMLNISGNRALQPNLPEWLGHFESFTLYAYDIDLTYLPSGLQASQVYCERNLTDSSY